MTHLYSGPVPGWARTLPPARGAWLPCEKRVYGLERSLRPAELASGLRQKLSRASKNVGSARWRDCSGALQRRGGVGTKRFRFIFPSKLGKLYFPNGPGKFCPFPGEGRAPLRLDLAATSSLERVGFSVSLLKTFRDDEPELF